MKKLLTTGFAFLLLISCKEHSTTNTSTTISTPSETEAVVIPTLMKGCYGYTNNGSKITFDITEVEDVVVGKLNIVLKEKDRNSGTFEGQLQGDKLIGTYTFNSEGIESKRQIAYHVQDNQLIEGYGEMNENGTSFKDTSAISYTSSMPLIKGDCKE